ncbi:transporter substrate-binding domain-containing protein [Nakamurella aerolata]|uniref:Transporter substrate-binding domain-containing protein n=1 Tax=Nakamurella aerolata TaxID=1656892 RepID=A0A849AKK6_9ACTN|nr:transporter substrate-binding domain-containing protein [Nakamurella aerolata]
MTDSTTNIRLRGRTMRAGLLAAGAALLLGVSACGSDSGTGSAGTDTAPAETTTGGGAGASGTNAGGAAGASAAGSGGAAAGASAAGGSAAAASGGASAAGSGGAAAGGTVDQATVDAAKQALIAPDKLTVCTTLPFEPFESDVNGEVVGFDIDLMDMVSKKLGVQTAVIDTPFEGIKSGEATASGKCDIAAAGMTITPERQKAMLFSEPYFDANFSLVVPSDSTAKTLADLKGKKLGGQASTTGLDYLNAHKDEFGYEVVEYTGFDLQSQAILTGQVDGVVNDVPVLAKLVKDNGSTVKAVEEIKSGDQYGFGMKLGNEALAKTVNATLATSKSDGSYDASYAKWIGAAPPK